MPDPTLFGILGIGRIVFILWMPPSAQFAVPLATIPEECTIQPEVTFGAKMAKFGHTLTLCQTLGLDRFRDLDFF